MTWPKPGAWAERSIRLLTCSPSPGGWSKVRAAVCWGPTPPLACEKPQQFSQIGKVKIMNSNTRTNCDRAIAATARILIEGGATGEMVLDRMLTFAAAQAAAWTSTQEAARAFRMMADTIESGVFAQVEASEGRTRH